MASKKWFSVVVALVVLGVIVVGCGPATPAPAAPTEAPAPVAEEPTEEAEEPAAPVEEAVGGGTAIYVVGADAESLDPPNMTQMTSELVARLIHDGLVAFSPEIEIIPGIAESWDISPDGLTYTFHLRPDLKFQDGTPCDAEAVKYCIDRMVNEDTMKSGLHRDLVKSTRAVDPTTFEIVLNQPFATYLNNLAHAASMIYSPTAHKEYGDDLTLHPVGTGPFKLVEWKKGDQVILERWDESWRGKPNLDQVIFKVVPEESSRALMLESGDAHLMAFVPPEIAERLEDNEDIVVEQYQSARVLGLSLNNQWGPFQDQRVRQALNYAINNDSIVENIYQGHAKASGGPSGPLITGSYEVPPYPYDPEKAKELLAEAGYPDGLEVTLLSPKGRFLKDAELVQEVQKQLAEVGIKVNLELMEYAAFSAAMHKGVDETDMQMFLQGWVPSTGEARWTMYAMFDCDMWVPTGSNGSFYCNPEMDELIEKASSAPTLEERDEYLKQAQQLAHDEAVWVYLLATPQIAARSKNLHDPWLSAFEFVTVSEDTSLDE
jgi:peptide/nickel transport system substrate-binding protein